MKTICINRNHLLEKEISCVREKSRALFIDKSGISILQNYSDILMLPGGKRKKGEDSVEALRREVFEELGILLEENEIQPLVSIDISVKDYPSTDGSFTNRRSITDYYLVYSDKKPNNQTSKSERELSKNFQTFEIAIEEILSLVLNYQSINPRNKYLQEEFSLVFQEYLQRIEQDASIIDDKGKIFIKK